MVRDRAKYEMLRYDLQRVLAQLDELDCPVAAAHIASAIDALERDMALKPSDVPPVPAHEYAAALRSAFGTRAEEITRNQIKFATGDALQSWTEILGHLQL